MSFGHPYILNIDGCIHDGWLVISPFEGTYDKEFLYYLVSSQFAYDQFSLVASGGVVSNLNSDKVAASLFPLPSIAEQERIVANIERWFALIDEVETGKAHLESVISQTKSKILNLAIQGKLVEQDPIDEPAEAMLRRINPTWSPCDTSQYPYVIPESWALCLLGDISDYGKCSNTSVSEIKDNEWVLELEDIEKDSGRILHRLIKQERRINGVRHPFKKSMILYSKLRTYLNKVLVADKDGYCSTEIIPICPIEELSSDFLCLVLRSPYYLSYTSMCGYGVKMPRLSTEDARRSIIPVPPLAEQHRIVAKVEELFGQLDEILAQLD